MHSSRLRRTCLLLLWLACGILPGTRAADWPIPRGPSREPEPYHYDRAAWNSVPREYLEDAPACILYAASSALVEANGTIETIIHELVRFNGRKGIDRLGEFTLITYDPSYETLTLNEARVHKPDDRILGIEPRHVHLRDVATDYQVYEREKQLIISFPSLEVGDVIEVKWTVRGRNPEHDGQYFQRYTFGDDDYPVVRDEFRVRVPRDRPLVYAVVGGKVVPEVRDTVDGRTYSWRVRHRRELPRHDDLPPKDEMRLQVSCSTFTSWEEVGRWKQRLRAECWECPPDVRKIVAEVTHGLTTPRERARALTYWVRRNIRYVSAGERHDYTPHRPSVVLANRFGDCKDQAQLLAVMLREAEVPVALATLGVRGDGQVLPEVPSPWGTHAILLVTLMDEGKATKQHWIDTTASHAGWDFLPRSDCDRLCYVTDEAGLRLVRTPALTPADCRIEQTTHVRVGADGSSRCERSMVYHGSAAIGQRSDWADEPIGERRRLVAAEVQDAFSHARLVRLQIDEAGLRDPEQPVRALLTFEVPTHFSGEDTREGSVSDSKVWSRLLAYNIDHDRAFAVDMGTPVELHHRYVIELPPVYRFDGLPRARTVRSRWGTFSRTVQSDGPGRLELTMFTRLERPRIEPKDFESFRKFHDEVSKSYRVWLDLKPVSEIENAALVEAQLACCPEDAHSARLLAQLYRQADRPEDARRVLRRSLHYCPHDEVLWGLAVELTETLGEQEEAQREMMRRFPTESRYAIALGATLIQRRKHAEAAALLEPLTRKGLPPLRALAHYQLACSAAAQNKSNEALRHLDAGLRADPATVQTVPALTLRGRMHERVGNSARAIEAYRQALRLDAEAEEVLDCLIRVTIANGDQAAALEYLRRSTLLAGQNVPRLVKVAGWHLQLNRLDDAFDLALRAREIGFHEGAQRVLGLVQWRRGDAEQAVLHLDKAEPDGEVLGSLIGAHVQLGNLTEAERLLELAEKQIEKAPALQAAAERVRSLAVRRDELLQTIAPIAEKLASCRQAIERTLCAEELHRQGEVPAKVERLLALVFRGGPAIGPAWALRGLLALERGRFERALVDAEHAIVQGPVNATAYYVRGRVRLEQRRPDAAADLEAAARLSRRQDAPILHALATALLRSGKPRDALAAQQEAIRLAPNDPELREQLQALEGVQMEDERTPRR